MIVVAIFITSLFFFYFIKIFNYSRGWCKLTEHDSTDVDDFLFISVVVALRNEEKNLPALLNSLKIQDYPQTHFEIILVNDHSTDGSENVIEKYLNEAENLIYIHLPYKQAGKKSALNRGVDKASGELILFTDADCVVSSQWISSYVSYYQQHSVKMIIGPVFLNQTSFFTGMQALDFIALIASGAGAAGIHRPVMCNGANLAVEKAAFISHFNQQGKNHASGDDIFLLSSMKKESVKQVGFIKSTKNKVFTVAQNTLKDFFQQRLRWASKAGAYSDLQMVYTGLLVFCVNMAIIAMLIFAVFSKFFLGLFILLVTLKLIADYMLLQVFSAYYKQKKILVYFYPLFIVYPFYIFFIALFSIFHKVTWKGRKM